MTHILILLVSTRANKNQKTEELQHQQNYPSFQVQDQPEELYDGEEGKSGQPPAEASAKLNTWWPKLANKGMMV